MRFLSLGVESCHTYERVMSHIWKSHVTHMKESYCDMTLFPRGSWAWAVLWMRHGWLSHVTHVKESCHTYEKSHGTHMKRVMSHIWKSLVTHMKQSCHTYERVMSHIRKSHVTHINESCHTCDLIVCMKFLSLAVLWMSHIWYVCIYIYTHTKEWCHTHTDDMYVYIYTHIWRSDVTRIHSPVFMRFLSLSSFSWKWFIVVLVPCTCIYIYVYVYKHIWVLLYL